MADQLPQYLIKSFTTVLNQPQHASDPTLFFGPYMRLLYYLFDPNNDFEIHPQFHAIPLSSDWDNVCVDATFTVEYHQHPVMFIHVNESQMEPDSEQMRNRFLDLRHRLVTPRFPAVVACGTRLFFYEYVAATKTLTPPAMPAAARISNDVLAPNYDLLEASGIARLRQEVQSVIEMCQALN
ncbi:hypothetical protein D9613_008325 [Agrocybe pediades]|uniref:Uncharacterized protein n=1 Tax=Agrocybe pediades TaxID=84607 RepID=A0A8H4QT11_9AGAR|nr:hypothetical protein D9613_008325 [Agrocybe pediades]